MAGQIPGQTVNPISKITKLSDCFIGSAGEITRRERALPLACARVALRAFSAAARRCRTRCVRREFELSVERPMPTDSSQSAEYWLPGTEPKSRGKPLQFMQFLISGWYRYPQKHPLRKVAAAGRWRMTVHVRPLTHAQLTPWLHELGWRPECDTFT